MIAVLRVEPEIEVVLGSVFMAAFEPLDHIVEQILPRGRVTALTAPTGSGKTAISTSIELHVAAGLAFAGRDTVTGGGRVLALVGENPHDKCMRMIATAQHMALAKDVLDRVLVVEDVFDIEANMEAIFQTINRYGSVALVTIDTSAAFYVGDEENANVAMRRHASMFRQLTRLPGQPAVLVLCHPTKSATRESLLPRGGGAFLAEIDGNLTAWKDEGEIVTLHWSGKFRGPTFDPIRLELRPVDLQGLADRKGRPIPSVIALHVAEERAAQLAEKEYDDQDRLLIQMQRRPGSSLRELAMACGWTNGTGKPSATRVTRRLEKLRASQLVEQDRKGQWRLTSKGQKEADALP